jgi:hypothetical protein
MPKVKTRLVENLDQVVTLRMLRTELLEYNTQMMQLLNDWRVEMMGMHKDHQEEMAVLLSSSFLHN